MRLELAQVRGLRLVRGFSFTLLAEAPLRLGIAYANGEDPKYKIAAIGEERIRRPSAPGARSVVHTHTRKHGFGWTERCLNFCRLSGFRVRWLG